MARKGIGGWLLLYVLMLTLHGILYLSAVYVLGAPGFVFFLFTVDVALVAIALVTLFIRSATAKLWNIVAMVVSVMVAFLSSGMNTINFIPNSAPSIALSTAISVAWIGYWIRSKRVKNTFR